MNQQDRIEELERQVADLTETVSDLVLDVTKLRRALRKALRLVAEHTNTSNSVSSDPQPDDAE